MTNSLFHFSLILVMDKKQCADEYKENWPGTYWLNKAAELLFSVDLNVLREQHETNLPFIAETDAKLANAKTQLKTCYDRFNKALRTNDKKEMAIAQSDADLTNERCDRYQHEMCCLWEPWALARALCWMSRSSQSPPLYK